MSTTEAVDRAPDGGGGDAARDEGIARTEGVEARAGGTTDAGKKPRKPYTQTRARVSWTAKEHARFVKALQLYHRDWKKIEAFVGTKSVIQIRSHAQKYFLKKMKSGEGDELPPPRLKRSAGTQRANLASDALLLNFTTAADGSLVAQPNAAERKALEVRQVPDFENIYGFLAECFKVNPHSDTPNVEPVEKSMKELARIDRETALLLLGNLRKNLQSKELWEQQRELIQDGFITFLAKEDLEQLLPRVGSSIDHQSQPAKRDVAVDTSDAPNRCAPFGSGERGSNGDASGGTSNEATFTNKIVQE